MNKPKNKLTFKMTGYKDLDRLLTKINDGADINIQDNDGNTALIYTFNNGNLDICKLLIENGADINIQNNDGETALMATCYYNEDVERCNILIEKGANLNAQDIHGNTALIVASMEGHTEICKFLIDNGADINIKDTYGDTAIDTMKGRGIYKQVEPFKIIGVRYLKEVFKEQAEDYLDIFETTLYNQDLELEDIKANIDMFYSTVISKMDNIAINESVEL